MAGPKPKIGRIRKPTPAQLKGIVEKLDAEMDLINEQVRQNYLLEFQSGIVLICDHGYFRVYIDPASPVDAYSIFFLNKHTREIFRLKGEIAKQYLNTLLYYNGKIAVKSDKPNAKVVDFPISNESPSQQSADLLISHLSRYALMHGKKGITVLKQYYTADVPAEDTNTDTYSNIPFNSSSLVAFAEEYEMKNDTIVFENWKEYPKVKNYSKSLYIRRPGKPCQILLHETDTFSDMRIDKVEHRESKYYSVPHFCINNVADDGKGRIVQFIDIAMQSLQGEQSNQRSIGIEFVNRPYIIGDDSKLRSSTEGLYLETKVGDLFIPMEFYAKKPENGIFFELIILSEKVKNGKALLAIGKEKKKRRSSEEEVEEGAGKQDKTIATETEKEEPVLKNDGTQVIKNGKPQVKKVKEITFKFAKSEKFFNLAFLIGFMVKNGLVKGVTDLSDKTFHKYIVTNDKRDFYVFQNGRSGDKYFYDMNLPGIMTHKMISARGGHGDGAPQGLFVYLKFVKKIKDEVLIPKMIEILLAEKTESEKKVIKIDAVSEYNSKTEDFTSPPARPVKISLSRIIDVTDLPD